jgi:hypothetical protein
LEYVYKRRGQGKNITSERPLCHDSSTSAKDVGAAEMYNAKRDRTVKMRRRSRDRFIIFISDLRGLKDLNKGSGGYKRLDKHTRGEKR